MAIHARIPWPKQAERELAEARADFRFWQSGYEATTKMSETNNRVIKSANERKVALQREALRASTTAARAAERLALLAPQGAKP